MNEIFAIGLGGNLGSRAEIKRRIETAASAVFEVADREFELSPICVSVPMGPVQEQPEFLNAVALSRTLPNIVPEALMAVILDLEVYLGRDRRSEIAQGPRAIDIDFLLWGDIAISSGGAVDLCVPHPRLHQRKFVLAPLEKLLGGDFSIAGSTVATMLANPEVAAQQISWLPDP